MVPSALSCKTPTYAICYQYLQWIIHALSPTHNIYNANSPSKNWSKKLVFFGPHFCAQASHIGNGAVATLRPNPHFCNLLSIFTIQTTPLFQKPQFFTLNNRLLISKQTCGWCPHVHIYNENDSGVSKTLFFQWKSSLAHMDDHQKWLSKSAHRNKTRSRLRETLFVFVNRAFGSRQLCFFPAPVKRNQCGCHVFLFCLPAGFWRSPNSGGLPEDWTGRKQTKRPWGALVVESSPKRFGRAFRTAVRAL